MHGLPGVEGFMYPNEVELQWSVLIVIYPYLTGLVAGAFILASLERVFDVHVVKPTYRLALLTALSFLLIAPLPLQLHLGHPERSFEMYLTPHRSSAMAMFGFVYLWYLLGVLVIEIWLDYRRDIVLMWKESRGLTRTLYAVLALGSDNISERALRIDDRVARTVTVIGIPSAFLLHGYVGFIFGSIKANPWWSTPLMPVVFLFSAMVSGIALVLLVYTAMMVARRQTLNMPCLDTIAKYLLYAFLVDAALELLDLIHRIYEADESFKALDFMVKTRLFFSQIVLQIILGTLVPIALLGATQLKAFTPQVRRWMYSTAATLALIGIFAMRWNVVIGGQLFSKSFLGYTTYKLDFVAREGLLPAVVLLVLPFLVLAVLVKILPPFESASQHVKESPMPRGVIGAVVFICLASPVVDRAMAGQVLRGTVLDPSSAPIPGAHVTVIASGAASSLLTDDRGEFPLSIPSGAIVLTVAADGFVEHVQSLDASSVTRERIVVVLQVAAIHEVLTVTGTPSEAASVVTSATRTPTPLRDIPQAISIVTSALIDDQRMQSMADVVRYMPGVGIAQGEGNRDTPVLRGNSTTADFFVDGIRDDVQYFRDLYNVDRVEALKGPNAMAFGRGGVGGVINRVTRQASFSTTREVGLQLGSWDNRRLTADLGGSRGQTMSLRVTGMYENSGSYRDGVGIERSGVNPTIAFVLGPRTMFRAGYEHFDDRRTADRGIPSLEGRPVSTSTSTFFGDPRLSRSQAAIDVASALVEHYFGPRATIRNRISYGQYDKFYQNVYPGAVNASGLVSLSAYSHAADRENLFDQLDLIVRPRTGRIEHTLLFGSEYGRQVTDNLRQTGYFANGATSVLVPLGQPTVSTAVAFRNNAADAHNRSLASAKAVYAQDQIAISPHVQTIVGLRVEHLTVLLRDKRTGMPLESRDQLLSPRVGLIIKPSALASLYASYGMSYLPRAGEQLASLSLTNQALEPERFRSYEVGAKWQVRPSLEAAAAVYRLERGNVAVPDAVDPARSILVDAQRTHGVELGVMGNVTRSWTVTGGYAYQDGHITRSISPSARAGATLAQLPRHSLSLWNKYDISHRVGLGIGVISRGLVFTSTDNAVVLPRFVRLDGALLYQLSAKLRLQTNIENLLDARYYAFAHNNTNITPGSPRALRVALTTRF